MVSCIIASRNMPGAVPRTSTFALNNATRPFVLALADKGFPRALIDDVHLRNGLNVHDGKITCRAVADALRLPYTPAAEMLEADDLRLRKRLFDASNTTNRP